MMSNQETRIKRGHVTLMKHPQTALYSGVMLMGTSSVEEHVPTAYTDGVNKKYGRKFLESIDSEPKVRGLILHENLHVALKQVVFGRPMFLENPKMANLAADFVVNDIISCIDGTVAGTSERIAELPDGGVYDAMFHDWSMREVYNYLKKNAKSGGSGKGKGKGKGQGGQGNVPPSGGTQSNDDDDGDGDGDTVTVNGKTYDISQLDEHDFIGREVTAEEAKEIIDGIDKALREGGMLAGRMGAKIPRAISELLEPKIDWREALREFVSSTTKGNDEFTWRRMNKRHMANDIYLPSVENESIGEIVVAIDTSGSIGSEQITEFATELVSICDLCQPEVVRVLWWDTEVHGEQIFKDNYSDIAKLLKPLGGGGTHVSCVSDYIVKNKIKAECVLVFTDGYVESDIDWKITDPTLWMVTQRRDFEPPMGKKVMFGDD
jgi:predicted metal-dependent peptidase